MHMRSESDSDFIQRRKRLVACWPVAASVLIATVIGIGTWSWTNAPFLANPGRVAKALTYGTVPHHHLETAAMLLPVLFWLVLFLMILFIGIGFAFIATEKRYLKILAEQDKLLNTIR